MNLGLNDDFLTRQDPFGKEKLLIKHTADTSITYKTYENENLKIDENERKLTVIENKVTIRLNENDENENKNNLIDTDMNSIFRFNCKQIERFKIINLTIKKKSISRLRIVFMGPVPQLNFDIIRRFMRVVYVYNTEDHLFRTCSLIFNGKETSFPSIDIVCAQQRPTYNTNVEIKIEFTFSGKTFEKKLMCESLQIREIFIYEKRITESLEERNKRNISRPKRQGIVAAGVLGFLGSELVDHFMQNGFYEHTKNLENDVHIMKLNNIKTLTDIKSVLETTELYFDNTDKLLEKMSKNQCNANFLNRKIELEEFLHLICSEFLANLNFSLINIMNKVPTNQVIKLAEKLCVGLNQNIDQIFCNEFYQLKENYKILSIEPFGFERGKIGTILINVQLTLPFFMTLETKTYKLISIPKPLYTANNLNHFETSFIPEIIVELPNIDNRKIDISKNCPSTENSYFCNNKLLNMIHDKNNLCINSIFSNKTSSCENSYITSTTNCVILPITRSILYISHVGPVELIETDSKLSGIHLLDKPSKTFENTNITILNGPIMRSNFKIRCSASEYSHFMQPNALVQTVIIDNFENVTNNFGHLYNDLERFRDITKLNKTEIEKIVKQLKNVNENVLADIHSQQTNNNLNIPLLPENFISKSYDYSKKLLPIFIVSNTLILIYFVIKIFKYFVVKTAEKILNCCRGYQQTPQQEHQIIKPE